MNLYIKAVFKEKSKGQAFLIAVIFFLFISLSLVFASSLPAVSEFNNSKNLLNSKKSYFLAESGLEDMAYRVKNAKKYDSIENLALDGNLASTTVLDAYGDKEIISTGSVLSLVRKAKANLSTDSSVSFHYGVQVGNGGLIMQNNSTVDGNVYSNGPISGSNSNIIKGDAVSAGGGGTIDGIHSTSSVYAHNISNSTIDKDAYYVNFSNNTVLGSLYPGSADQPQLTLPISDSLILEWENEATSTIINSPCPYTINSEATLGNVKIVCDLKITGGAVITLTGPVWVSGNIEIGNTALIKLDSALGNKSVAVIADNLANRITSSKISFENSATFQNSGTKGSYILAVSMNNSAESGGNEKAIEVENSANGDVIVYAGHGEVELKNSISLREVSAYKIRLSNTAKVIYETGIANMIFKSGPSGGYGISSWKEAN